MSLQFSALAMRVWSGCKVWTAEWAQLDFFFTMLSVTDGEARASDLNEITKDLRKENITFSVYCIL